MSTQPRDERLYPNDRIQDQRSEGQRDRDRILYASAFRRLGGVTQVAAANERLVFRNRLTHTLEVAQVARRLAEYVNHTQGGLAEELGGIDPDVVEAAALAHDLGHPPFGHVAENKLDDLLRKSDNSDGFEGNPQSFRVVTKLALRHQDFLGLNLTRATLNAILKYPWLRGTGGDLRERKWGAYGSECKEFEWARELGPDGAKSPEAELMDWADDIAYSVHDLDDFYRAGLIPFDRILINDDVRDEFLRKVRRRWDVEGEPNHPKGRKGLTKAFKTLIGILQEQFRPLIQPLTNPYEGNREQRSSLRSLTALLIRRYVIGDVDIGDTSTGQTVMELRKPNEDYPRCVSIDPEFLAEVTMLKELTREYVIHSPALATQEYGQRKLIEDLFEFLLDAASKSDFGLFPPRYSELLEQRSGDSDREITRVVADYISGMTERQAVELHQRLTGASLGSLLDPLSP